MSTIDLTIQRVAGLDKQLASRLLVWLDTQQAVKVAPSQERPIGARAMIGFALQGGRSSRTTADWMKELHEGDDD